MTSDSSASSADAAMEKSVGRGALLLTASKFWFMISGFVIQYALTKVFERATSDPVEAQRWYGVYSVATGLGAILNAFVYQGTTQAVARFTGMDPANSGGVLRSAYKLQALLGGGFFIAWFAAAPYVAENFHHNPALTAPLRYAALILLGYAFYAPVMGSLTGRRLFTRQAVVDLSYSTLKIVCIAGFAFFLGGALGRAESAVAGFAAASFVVLALSLVLLPKGGASRGPSVAELFKFQFFTMLLSGLVAYVTQADLQFLQFWSPGTPEEIELISGRYRPAQLFATIPFQAVFAITFILFPLVSGLAEDQTEKLRGYVRQTTKYALVIATMIGACFAAAPERAVGLLFSASYEGPAAAPLRIAVLGYVAFSVFFIMLAVVTASGRAKTSAALVGVIALVQVIVSAIVIPVRGPVGAATATACAMVAGLIGVHLWQRKTWGAGLDLGLSARTLIAGALAAALPHLLLDAHTILGRPGFMSAVGYGVDAQGNPAAGLLAKATTVAVFGATAVVFVVLLFVLRVLDAEDRSRFARVLGRGKPRA